MKKRIVTIFITLALLLTLVPTVALAETQTLPANGGSLDSGTYTLKSDITITSPIVIPSNTTVIIDLNGHTLTYIGSSNAITVSGTLTLQDSNASGPNSVGNAGTAGTTNNNDGTYTTTYPVSSWDAQSHQVVTNWYTYTSGAVFASCAGVAVSSGGSFTMMSGTITADSSYVSYGTGVTDKGTFSLCGGVISGFKSYGVHVFKSSAEMSGGIITNNTHSGVAIETDDADVKSTFTMSGGYIVNNTQTVNSYSGYGGGGVCVGWKTTFNMLGGFITDNKVTASNTAYPAYGGGVYVGNGDTTLTGPSTTATSVTIVNNSANYGGGIYYSSGKTLSLKGVSIEGNTANEDGGGIAVTGGQVSLWGGVLVTGNTAGNSGGGIANRYTNALVVNGAKVYGNTATTQGADIYLENASELRLARVSTGGDGWYRDTTADRAAGATLTRYSGTFYSTGVFQSTTAQALKVTTSEKAITEATVNLSAPTVGSAAPTASVLEGANYTASVSWNSENFVCGNEYTATITLAAKSDYYLADNIAVTVPGATNVTQSWNTNGDRDYNNATLIVTATFTAKGVVAVPVIASKTYTGETLTANVSRTDGYTVTKNDGGINAGNYEVQLTLNDNYVWADSSVDTTRTLIFQITKDDSPTVSMADVSVTYGTAYTMTATAKTSAGNNIADAQLTYTYYIGEDTSGTTSKPVDAGTYTVKAELQGTDNYASTSTTATLTIQEATLQGVTAEGYSGTYDGQSHSISVAYSAFPDTATYSYKGKVDADYSNTNPQYANVGTYTVYYKVEVANYEPVTGYVSVEIKAAQPQIQLTAKEANYTGSPIEIDAATVTWVNNETFDGTITYTYYSDAECKTALEGAPSAIGTYYVIASIPASGNYTATASTAATLTINAPSTSESDEPENPDEETPPTDDDSANSGDDDGSNNEDTSSSNNSTWYPDYSSRPTGSTASTPSTDTTSTLPTETGTVADTQVTDEVVSVTTVTDEETGAVTTTTEKADGSTTVVEEQTDGTVTTTATDADGVETVTVDVPGEAVTASVTLPEGVDEAVVTIPADLTPGTVAVNADTGEIILLSVLTEDGMLVKVEGDVEIILEDRSTDFVDVPDTYWGSDEIAFVSGHALFNGTGEDTFTPEGDMTRAMFLTVLARLDGADTAAGDTWDEVGINWAVERGISDGTAPEASITREQLVTMLYRYAGSPAVDGSLAAFADAANVSDYAADAMTWAVSTGLINGMNGSLAPDATATRAQVAAIMKRFCEYLVK